MESMESIKLIVGIIVHHQGESKTINKGCNNYNRIEKKAITCIIVITTAQSPKLLQPHLLAT